VSAEIGADEVSTPPEHSHSKETAMSSSVMVTQKSTEAPGLFVETQERRSPFMKQPLCMAAGVSVSGALYFVAPTVLGCLLAIAALIIGFYLFDQLLVVVRELLNAVIHRQSVKPPASLVVFGVILSVVCTAIGFFWKPGTVTVSVVPFRAIWTVISIAGHFACLGALAFSVSVIQAAPKFRDSSG
jgi:hypothetical protein